MDLIDRSLSSSAAVCYEPHLLDSSAGHAGAGASRPPRGGPVSPVSPLASSQCDTDNGGLVLPEGFCATLVASQLGPVRQLAVRPNGDLYAALSGKPGDNTGGVLAFRDRDGDGKPDERASFGPGGRKRCEAARWLSVLRPERSRGALPLRERASCSLRGKKK